MTQFIKRIIGTALHKRYDLEQEFQPGINILHGRNGTGKTTLLHILANVLNGSYERFAFLSFESIEVEIDDPNALFSSKLELIRQKSTHDPEIRILRDGAEIETISIRQMVESEKRDQERELLRRGYDPKEKKSTAPLPAAYFPAFRTMIEAWTSFEDRTDRVIRYPETEFERFRRYGVSRPALSTTVFARDLFGDFVPNLSYPSPLEIEQRITSEVNTAVLAIGRTDRELLSRVFLDVFTALSRRGKAIDKQPEDIIQEITQLSDQLAEYPLRAETDKGVFPQLRQLLRSAEVTQGLREENAVQILDVYRKSLVERLKVQTDSFKGIEKYLDSVNKFLEGKKLVISPDERRKADLTISLQFDDGSNSSIRTLSSGERQIVTLIYAATHMSEQKVVLIDEPEISLHIDWQRDLLNSMAQQLGNRQIIACTHSPIIAADHEERMFELKMLSTHSSSTESTDDQEDLALNP